MLQVDHHPLLDLRAFTAEFPRPLGELPSPPEGGPVNKCVKRDQAGTRFLSLLLRTPLTYAAPSATSASSSGALSLRKLFSATSSVFQMTAVAFLTFL